MADSRVGHAQDGLLLEGSGDTGKRADRDHPLGAGGVEATIADLARYARACLFPPPTRLGAALRRAQTACVRIGAPSSPDETGSTEQALGWLVRDTTIREHSGATAGFTACVSLDPRQGRAVALLAAYGGSIAPASHMKSAAQRVLRAEDPRAPQPPQPFPDWRTVALDVVRSLRAGEFEHVHARLAPPRREKTTPARSSCASPSCPTASWAASRPCPGRRQSQRPSKRGVAAVSYGKVEITSA